ncbi:MAG: hypothetical protein ABUL55_02210 [Pseudomonadota bacterium]
MIIRLEMPHGALIHQAEIVSDREPPDVVFWDRRAFRFVRTDGLWDQKRHIYREASVCDLSAGAEMIDAPAAAPNANENTKGGQRVRLNLTQQQSETLRRVRLRGGYASNKATVLAGLAALEGVNAVSNEALLTLLAKRLQTAAPRVRQLDKAG